MKNNEQNGSAAKHNQFVSLASLAGPATVSPAKSNARILLLKPPYFTPWTPPLGIAILKAFLTQHGYSVTCFDFNIDPELWGMHHNYFSALQQFDRTILNDGYSKLWWILNAHLLAYFNRATRAEIAELLDIILPLYGIRASRSVSSTLLPLVENYFKRLDEIASKIDFSSYDVVGTSTYTTSLGSSLWLLRKAKEQSGNIKTVMGGGAFADDLALGSDNLEILLRDYPFIDHVVLGEGEMLFLQLLNGSLAHKRLISLADLKGATLDMKDVPVPDFSDLDLENYYHLTIEGARSCPFQCSFCSETIQWGEYRKKPFELLAEQVVGLSRQYGIREFFMGDSLMNPYLIPFASELLKRNANVLYDGYLRADRPVTHKKHVSAWAASGLFRVRLGIESAAPNVLKSMDKKTTPEVIAQVLKTLAAAGIRTTTYWIVGFPGETEADFQETCEFIRQNHKYIYELEAHPYYYYPYGQVGSRLYQCKELYPEQVTNLTHFKVWEVVDANPNRDVRYQRLKRICALASELGIPNIYTMAERYAAEDRWRNLHPAAIEVYPGTHTERTPAIAVKELPFLSNVITSHAGKSICFHCAVAKPLDRDLLIKAFAKLFEYHQILRMRLDDDRYVLSSEQTDIVATAVREMQSLSEESYRELIADLSPSHGLSLRLGLLRHEASTDVLLCGHPGIFDPASMAYLMEDLCRIYEQMESGKKISLPRSDRTYSDAASMLPTSDARYNQPAEGILKLKHKSTIPMEASLITPELMARVVQSASSAIAAAGCTSFAVLAEPRIFVRELAGVTGVLSSLQLHRAKLTQLEDLEPEIESIKSELALSRGNNTDPDELSSAPVLINLEYLVKSPWLGEDIWKPQGFVIHPSVHPCRYEVEILIVARPEGIQVQVLHQEMPGSEELAGRIGTEFAAQMCSMIQCSRKVNEAEQFWSAEFGPPLPERKPVTTDFADHIGNLSIISCDLDGCGAGIMESGAPDHVSLLAVYAMVLARATGQNFVDVAVKMPGSKQQLLPVRFVVEDGVTFAQFRQVVQETLARTLKHGQYSRAVLNRFTTPEIVRYGFLIVSEDGWHTDACEHVLESSLALALVLNEQSRETYLIHTESFGTDKSVSIRNWLSTLLRTLERNENADLEDLFLAPEISTAIEVTIQTPELEENFHF
jgi:radical SAM superfamily enzyme YgiQ (UPF0313 family)